MNRLKSLDFLRGIALLLIFLRHQKVNQYTYEIAWLGLELFFVLSGFLVSGLIFKEYKKFNKVDGKHFLMRRGFKIYPMYYFSFIPYYFFLKWNNGAIEWNKWWAETIFIQNYYNGYGYLHFSSWSLALEEHFYIGLIVTMWLILNKFKVKIQNYPFQFFATIVVLQVIVLLFRYNSFSILESSIKPFTYSHHRIDSILFGILISYFYYFQVEKLTQYYNAHKKIIFLFIILALSWTPFVGVTNNIWAFTIGITLAYLAVGHILLSFLLSNASLKLTNTVWIQKLVLVISKIGIYSFPSYIFHIMVNRIYYEFTQNSSFFQQNLIAFICTSSLSILLGYLLSITLEKYAFKIRDKYLPSKQIH